MAKDRLIIRFEHDEGSYEAVYEHNCISGNDPLFWDWLKSAFTTIGFSFVTKELDYD